MDSNIATYQTWLVNLKQITFKCSFNTGIGMLRWYTSMSSKSTFSIQVKFMLLRSALALGIFFLLSSLHTTQWLDKSQSQYHLYQPHNPHHTYIYYNTEAYKEIINPKRTETSRQQPLVRSMLWDRGKKTTPFTSSTFFFRLFCFVLWVPIHYYLYQIDIDPVSYKFYSLSLLGKQSRNFWYILLHFNIVQLNAL